MELGANRFLSFFGESTRRLLESRAQIRDLPDGTLLFEEGAPSDCVYLVLEGEIALFKRPSAEREQLLAKVGPGDYFGEVGILDDAGRSTGARAAGTTRVAVVPRDAVQEALHAEPPQVTIHLFRRILEYLRTTNDRFIGAVVRKEKMQFIGEMAGAIIHDFKSPMTGILMASQFIAKQVDDPQVRRWCELIEQQINRMIAMAQELLDYSRGSPSLDRKPTRVSDLIASFESLNGDFISKSGAMLRTIPIEAEIKIDSGRMLRVLQNLVGNAVDAFADKTGGIVEIICQSAEGGVWIMVRDNGPGIPEKIREHLFEPFITHGKAHGTGLGTAIAKSIVEAHGGQLSFQTETGKGTIFYIWLPGAA
ncbi:MAG TPA: ATP-binding protein [Verrucomicrobiae bacterium]|nr:ATP-binding protein [Verrucomicrobiae bacterium]